jgi:hypothetical protein
MDRPLKRRRALRKGLLLLLASIGSGTVLYSAAAAGLRLLRNHPPDSIRELPSPDGRYRLVITEDLAGFPGAVCIKQVYALGARATLDRNDEDNLLYAGACDGLRDLRWDGARVRGSIDAALAVADVRSMKLRHLGANGGVEVDWSSK